MRQTGDSLAATLDTQQFICLNNMHVIVPKAQSLSLKFILGLISLRVANWYYHTLNPEVGEALAEVKRTNVAQLPMLSLDLKKPADKARHDKLVVLVDKLLGLMPKLRAATLDREKAALQNAVTPPTSKSIDSCMNPMNSRPKKSPSSKARKVGRATPCAPPPANQRVSVCEDVARGATRPTNHSREFREWQSSLPTQLERDTLLTPECKGEVASLSGVGDDARYFQISVILTDGHHAAGQFGRGAGGGARERGGRGVGQGLCSRPPRAGRCRRT